MEQRGLLKEQIVSLFTRYEVLQSKDECVLHFVGSAKVLRQVHGTELLSDSSPDLFTIHYPAMDWAYNGTDHQYEFLSAERPAYMA